MDVNDEIVVDFPGCAQMELPQEVRERLKTADAVLREPHGYIIRCAISRLENGKPYAGFDYVWLPSQVPEE